MNHHKVLNVPSISREFLFEDPDIFEAPSSIAEGDQVKVQMSPMTGRVTTREKQGLYK